MYRSLTKRQIDREKSDIRRKIEEISKDPKKALKFLVDAGIFTQDGNLREEYRHKKTRKEQDEDFSS